MLFNSDGINILEYRLLVGSKEVFKIHELILYCISPIVPVMCSWPFNINVTYSFLEKFLMYPFIIIEEKIIITTINN